MRLELAVIVMLGLPAMAAAQPAVSVPGGVAPLPPIGLPLPQIGLPLPQIGLPLPQIGLPLPQIGLPPAAASPRHSTVNGAAPEMRRQRRSPIYFIPAYAWRYPYEAPSAMPSLPDGSPTNPKAQPLPGRLRLDIEPGGAGAQQLYVDSYYVGTLEDFSGEVELEAGPHTVEIQAPGYETLHIDVKIAEGRSITYRGTLKPTDTTPAPDAAVPSSTSVPPPTPLTLYIIPGCYIGNVPPEDAGLPASCDLSRVVTIKK
jgi:hypothetical protein